MFKLGFNIDHVATLRNARGEGYPDILQIAKLAQESSIHQITAHLREDRRHIKDQDIFDLKSWDGLPLNLEMAVTEEMLSIATRVKPFSVCLVPEKRNEVTTEGGLDLKTLSNDKIKNYIQTLRDAGIKVSLFLDSNEEQIERALKLPISSIEFNTGAYANMPSTEQKLKEVNKISLLAKSIIKAGVQAHAGHGLNYYNIEDISSIPEITEFNIGHFLVAESIKVGIQKSLQKMLNIIACSRL